MVMVPVWRITLISGLALRQAQGKLQACSCVIPSLSTRGSYDVAMAWKRTGTPPSGIKGRKGSCEFRWMVSIDCCPCGAGNPGCRGHGADGRGSNEQVAGAGGNRPGARALEPAEGSWRCRSAEPADCDDGADSGAVGDLCRQPADPRTRSAHQRRS